MEKRKPPPGRGPCLGVNVALPLPATATMTPTTCHLYLLVVAGWYRRCSLLQIVSEAIMTHQAAARGREGLVGAAACCCFSCFSAATRFFRRCLSSSLLGGSVMSSRLKRSIAWVLNRPAAISLASSANSGECE